MSNEVDLVNYQLESGISPYYQIDEGEVPNAFKLVDEPSEIPGKRTQHLRGTWRTALTITSCASIVLSGCSHHPQPNTLKSQSATTSQEPKINGPVSTPVPEPTVLSETQTEGYHPDSRSIDPANLSIEAVARANGIPTTQYVEPKVRVSTNMYNQAVEIAGHASISPEGAMAIMEQQNIDFTRVLGGGLSIITYPGYPPVVFANEAHPLGNIRLPGRVNRFDLKSFFGGSDNDAFDLSQVGVNTYSIGFDESGMPMLKSLTFPINMEQASDKSENTYGFTFVVTTTDGKTYVEDTEFSNPVLAKLSFLRAKWNQAIKKYILFSGEPDRLESLSYLLPGPGEDVAQNPRGLQIDDETSLFLARILAHELDEIFAVSMVPNYRNPYNTEQREILSPDLSRYKY